MVEKKLMCEVDWLGLYDNIKPLKKPLSQMSSKELNQTEAYKEYQKSMRQRPGAKAKQREYNQRPRVKARRKKYQKQYQQRPEIKIKREIYCRDYYQRPNIKLNQKEYQRRYRQRPKVKAKIKKRQREYNQRPEIKIRLNKYHRDKRKTDLDYQIKSNLRGRINQTLKSNSKSRRTMKLTGCSIDYLKNYLESQFDDEMSWTNYGLRGWHIDHLVPCCRFDLTKEEEQLKCFNYTNLRPLWAKDNWSKSAKIY